MKQNARILSKELDSSAFRYIVGFIFDRLGLDEVVVKSTPEKWIMLEIPSSAGKLTIAPFLSGAAPENLLSSGVLHLNMVETDEFARELLSEQELPILALKNSSCPTPLVAWGSDFHTINFDLFGSAFYILTRVEEMTNTERDSHDRFPAKASHAFQNNYLQRPVVDEFIEILWACMKHLWPRLERKKTEFRLVLSHDVDVPFAEAFSSPLRICRSIAGDLIKRKSPGNAIKRVNNWYATKRGDFRKDTNYTFDRIMDLSEKHGIRSTFFFKTACTNPKYDDQYNIDHPFIRQLIRDIHTRGHEFGFHPSYETFMDPVQTRNEFLKLRKVCEEEGIEQEIWGGRQHYLRWKAPVTWRNSAEAGISYDSTLGYADHVGFRCGTCHFFPVFDITLQTALHIQEMPLIAMEESLLNPQYMSLCYQEAFFTADYLKRQCQKYKGIYSLLWHNNNFHEISERHLNRILYSS